LPLPVTTAGPVGLARSIVSGTASGLWPVALGSIAVCPGLSTCCLSSSWATRKLAARITNRKVRAILALAKEAVIVDEPRWGICERLASKNRNQKPAKWSHQMKSLLERTLPG